jgi:hypothetical protein
VDICRVAKNVAQILKYDITSCAGNGKRYLEISNVLYVAWIFKYDIASCAGNR